MPRANGAPTASGPESFALIVGAMKCGTTSLFQYLATHPRCHPYHSNAAERIAAFADRHEVEFRFLYIMRDPAERFVSQYMHARAGNWTTDRLRDWIYGEGRIYEFMYAFQLDEYTRRFPDRSILTLLFEDLRDDPAGTMARVIRFLGLDRMEDPGAVADGPHNPTATKHLEPLWWMRAKRLAPVRALRARLPTAVRHAAYEHLTRSGSHRYRLTPRQRADFVERLAPDLQRLEEAYAVDITRWESVRAARLHTR